MGKQHTADRTAGLAELATLAGSQSVNESGDQAPIGPNVPPRHFTMQSPLWGTCRIIPRDAEPADKVAMGYVTLEGAPDDLRLALWKDDRWLTHRMKPFGKPVLQSYRVEKADGSPLF